MLAVHDLARAAQELSALHPDAVASTRRVIGDVDTMLVRVPVGQRFEHVAKARALVLVLDGLGTVAVEDWRGTLAAGHLVDLPAGARLLASADGPTPLVLHLTHAVQPSLAEGEPAVVGPSDPAD